MPNSLVTQDFLFLVQESKEIRHKRVMTASQAIGALIFGMVNQGIVYAGWNPDWFQFFVGALLLGAILLNTYIRRRAEASI
jgi:ribose/xylose/arabinose/galactoside ABC-type transport system permease subunit